MKLRARLLVAGWCAALLCASLWAAARSPAPLASEAEAAPPTSFRADEPAGRHREELTRLWDEVKASLRRGAYQDALASLDRILASAPNDPRAQLYRALCQARLESPPPFLQLPPAALDTLKERLRREERAQRRTQVQLEALERGVKAEQARWDQELATLEHEAKRGGERQRRQAKAGAVARARADAERARHRARAEPAPAPPLAGAPEVLPAPLPGPLAPLPVPNAQLPVTRGRPAEGIELAPVTVPAAATGPAGEAAPGLVARAVPPPGMVQINADQMSVVSERRIAVAEGNVEVAYGDAFLTCDHLTLFTDTHDV